MSCVNRFTSEVSFGELVLSEASALDDPNGSVGPFTSSLPAESIGVDTVARSTDRSPLISAVSCRSAEEVLAMETTSTSAVPQEAVSAQL